jgi:plastocyanin
MRAIKFDADQECGAIHGGAKVLDPTVMSRGGQLANVIAWVSKGQERWTYVTPTKPVLIDQRGCMYEPHVLTLMVNQPLTIRTSDPLTHNIHATPARQDEFNHSQLKGAADMTERFPKEEVGVPIKCDIHTWMKAWAGVFDHPFHGVTRADGTVTIRVPPGQYEVSAWHEYRKFTKPEPKAVAVAAGETKEIEFVFEAR